VWVVVAHRNGFGRAISSSSPRRLLSRHFEYRSNGTRKPSLRTYGLDGDRRSPFGSLPNRPHSVRYRMPIASVPELHQHDIRESSWDKDGFRFNAALQAPCPHGQLIDSLRICTALLTRRGGRLNIKLRQNFA